MTLLKSPLDAWKEALLGQEPVEFSVIQQLADRTALTLRHLRRKGSVHRGVGFPSFPTTILRQQLQRDAASSCPKAVYIKPQVPYRLLQIGMSGRAFLAMVLGIDIETTSRFPELGYIVNVALSLNLGRNTVPVEPSPPPTLAFQRYKKKVFLFPIFTRLRKDVEARSHLETIKSPRGPGLVTMKKIPFMAHNVYLMTWLMFNIDGWAQRLWCGQDYCH